MAEKWAYLPRGILGEIMDRLFVTDIESCKDICESWNSAIREAVDLRLLHPIPSPPWLLIPPREGNTIDSSCSYYNPSSKEVRNQNSLKPLPPPEEAVCVGCSHGWLAFIDTKCVMSLINPLVPDQILLPPITTLPCFKSSFYSPDGDLQFLYWNVYTDSTNEESADDLHGNFIEKLVLSSAPSEEDCMAMMIYGNEHFLAICKIGDTSWTKLNQINPHYVDLYYSTSKKLLYALSSSDNPPSFEVWDLNDFSHPKNTSYLDTTIIHPSLSTEEQTLRSLCSQFECLAELNGNLLLLVRHHAKVDKDGQIVEDVPVHDYEDVQINGYDVPMRYVDTLPYKTFRFDAYEFDWVKLQWVSVKCLGAKGDGVLFLGRNNSLAFSASDFPELQANSVYFADTCEIYFFHVVICRRSYGGHDIGIFNFSNNEIDPCYYSWDNMKITPAPVWMDFS